jgi:hypothetical protein
MRLVIEMDGKEKDVALGTLMRGKIGLNGKRPRLVRVEGLSYVNDWEEPWRSKTLKWLTHHFIPSLDNPEDFPSDRMRELTDAFEAGYRQALRETSKRSAEDKKLADAFRTIAKEVRGLM